jgi:hypothetical protein
MRARRPTAWPAARRSRKCRKFYHPPGHRSGAVGSAGSPIDCRPLGRQAPRHPAHPAARPTVLGSGGRCQGNWWGRAPPAVRALITHPASTSVPHVRTCPAAGLVLWWSAHAYPSHGPVRRAVGVNSPWGVPGRRLHAAALQALASWRNASVHSDEHGVVLSSSHDHPMNRAVLALSPRNLMSAVSIITRSCGLACPGHQSHPPPTFPHRPDAWRRSSPAARELSLDARINTAIAR